MHTVNTIRKFPQALSEGDFDFGATPGRYDWDSLMDGTIWRMVHGTDFDVKPTSFITSAKKAANKRGKGLRIRQDGDDVVLQATDQPTS